MANRTGALIVRDTSGGGAGTGEARRIRARTASSSAGMAEERTTFAESTLPRSSIEKRTWTTPSSPRARAALG